MRAQSEQGLVCVEMSVDMTKAVSSLGVLSTSTPQSRQRPRHALSTWQSAPRNWDPELSVGQRVSEGLSSPFSAQLLLEAETVSDP